MMVVPVMTVAVAVMVAAVVVEMKVGMGCCCWLDGRERRARYYSDASRGGDADGYSLGRCRRCCHCCHHCC